MTIDIKVPSPGESITQVQLAAWLVQDGEYVEKDAEIVEIDSDKATLSISAEESGIIKLKAAEGDTINVGNVIASIDTSAAKPKGSGKKETVKKEESKAPPPAEDKKPLKSSATAVKETKNAEAGLHISPLARKIMNEKDISEENFIDYLKQFRVGREDVMAYEPSAGQDGLTLSPSWGGTRDVERKKMTTLRLKLSERLVYVKNQTAMLTTFNEVNMTPIMNIRKKNKEAFIKKYGYNIGFMSFFTKAVTIALNAFPQANSILDGDELVYHDYADIGIAVSSPKGLMVPVIRNAEALSMAEIEKAIKELADKARSNKITLDEMTGGTFTITNGGVFGSMLSTPILNPPQSAILGMHNIVERPIAVNGKVEIHPVMYVALSYDHRVIDGRESVGFLVTIKNLLENPVWMLTAGKNPEEVLLGL